MKKLRLISSTAVFALGALVLASSGVSARIICNDEGDCWHSTSAYEYPSGAHVTLHDDNWRWGDADRFAWREHEGRGYWHNHAWTAF